MPDFDAPNATPAERARDIMRRFPVKNGLIQPSDAAELEDFIRRACEAAEVNAGTFDFVSPPPQTIGELLVTVNLSNCEKCGQFRGHGHECAPSPLPLGRDE